MQLERQYLGTFFTRFVANGVCIRTLNVMNVEIHRCLMLELKGSFHINFIDSSADNEVIS